MKSNIKSITTLLIIVYAVL